MDLLRQGAPNVLWSLIAALIFLLATWGWQHRTARLGRVSLGAAALSSVAVVSLTLWDYLPRPSFAFVTAPTPAWLPFALGFALGVLLSPRLRTCFRWARARIRTPVQPAEPSTEELLAAFDSLRLEERGVLMMMWNTVYKDMNPYMRDNIAEKLEPRRGIFCDNAFSTPGWCESRDRPAPSWPSRLAERPRCWR